MLFNKIRVAVVEDNGMARSNIRNHLLHMGFIQISCFSNGRELKANIKRHKIDLLLMDFHLGQSKNGVEVVQDLQKMKFIGHSTCVMFITSDRMPLIIGQIVDVHPEALVIKPYTINNLQKNIHSCLNAHNYLMTVYNKMDAEEYTEALSLLDKLISKNDKPRFKSSLVKLRARILTKLGEFSEATKIYRNVLKRSDKVIWAKWGLIQSLFLDGQVTESETLLAQLTRSQLTNSKACEWLARISVSKNQYSKAEQYMTQINDGELSIPAARLKAYIYQAQDKSNEAIDLLEKKRESNKSIRERYDEISLDLARCYISEAEKSLANERKSDLTVAKYLIGSAGRKSLDPSLTIRKDYMHAMVAFLEGNEKKTREVLNREGMNDLKNAEISTITDAMNAWQNIGETEKAKELLQLSQKKLHDIEDGNEKTVSSMLIAKGEDTIGEKKPQALEFNRVGLEKYSGKQFLEATKDFYQAYTLFPREIAFSLNLLQSMVDGDLVMFEKVNTLEFVTELKNRQLSNNNRQRFEQIVSRVIKKKHIYNYAESTDEASKSTDETASA